MNKKINFEQLDKSFIKVTDVEVNKKEDFIVKYDIIEPFKTIMMEYEFEYDKGNEKGGITLNYNKKLLNKKEILWNDDKYPKHYENPRNFKITKLRTFR